MSKAFTKESDGASSDDLELDLNLDSDSQDGEPSVAASSRNYITPGGANRLKAELKKLLYEERPELVKTVAWAASNGDRSENGDYIYGKRRLREIDRRIRFLTKRLEAAEVIDPLTQSGSGILFGASVIVEDEEGDHKTYRIVGIDETDVRRGHVSWISPIAKALLGAKQGDAVLLKTPKGEEELHIISVKYEAFT